MQFSAIKSKLRRSSALLSGIALFVLFSSGIVRDDVPMKTYEKLAQQKQFDCVGKVFCKGEFEGSCTLIGGQYVLSAAHVFVQSDVYPDTLVMNGQHVIMERRVNFHTGPASDYIVQIGTKKYHVLSVVLFPNYLDSASSVHTDLAVIRLSEAVSDVSPAILSDMDDDLGKTITSVGYGTSGMAGDPSKQRSRELKLAGNNVIDSVGGTLQNTRPSLMFADMDDPTEPSLNVMGSALPLPLEYCVNGGDSGGGCFRNSAGVWRLVGVTTGLDIDLTRLQKYGDYGDVMSWTRVVLYSDWIKGKMTNP